MTEVSVRADWPVEVYRKRPVDVQAVLWDGTPERLEFLRSWTDACFDVDVDGDAWIYNDQENCQVACPVGHRVVRGRLGEFYPISPDALALTYESPAQRRARHEAESRLDATSYRYPDDVERIHVDLAAAPRVTYRNLLKSTFGRAHLGDCSTCQVHIAMIMN